MKLIKYIIICLVAVIYTATGQVTTPCVTDTLEIVLPGVKGPDYGPPVLDSVRISVQAAPDDYRMLYWVHGLNGNGSSWDKAATACEDSVAGDFKPREVYGRAPDYYESQSDIAAASWKFRQKLDLSIHLPPSYDRTKSFVIAHSQGGIVSRYTDYYYTRPGNGHDRMFGGIVTFGTPNQGAQIVNNQRLVSSFLHLMGSDMTAGPVKELTHSGNWLVRWLAEKVQVSQIQGLLLDMLSVHVGKYLINKSLPGITNQYRVNALMVADTLSRYESPSDLVAFYGVRDTLTYKYNVEYEDDGQIRTIPVLPVPISWATINYFLRSVNPEPYFKSEDNEHAWTLISGGVRADYQAKVDENEAARRKYEAEMLNALLTGQSMTMVKLHGGAMDLAEDRRNAWRRGVGFVDGFDRLYRIFIGALVSETEEDTTYTCECKLFSFGVVRIDRPEGMTCADVEAQLGPPGFARCQEKSKTTMRYVWRHKDSDGVVLAESAMNIPQHTWEPQKMEGSTHMGMRNDGNTKDALNKIFEGGVGEFFRTKEKSE